MEHRIFVNLIFFPHGQVFKTKLKTWANLSLTLIRKINLLKMKLLPPLLYVMRRSPSGFLNNLSPMLLVYSEGPAPLGFHHLYFRGPVLKAVSPPPLYLFLFYSVAAMLSHAHNWLVSDTPNSNACPGSYNFGFLQNFAGCSFLGCQSPHPLMISIEACS